MRTMQLDQLLPKDVADRLLAFKRDVERALPGVIEDVILFGSRARGDAQPDSDYDLAILLNSDVADDRGTWRQIWDVAWEHLDDGFFIQAVPLNAELFRSARTELAVRITADGVPVK